jgi:transmembrane sensor
VIEEKKIPQHIAEQAAQWQLLLDECSPEAFSEQQKAFNEWLQIDPIHVIANERVQHFLNQISQLKEPSDEQATDAFAQHRVFQQQKPQNIIPARKALQASFQQATQRKRKKAATTLLSLVLLISLPAAITLQKYPLSHLNADVVVTTGEWQKHTLADGSTISLAGKGAIDIDYTNAQRIITLHHGEIYIDVAADIHRPFIVKTQYGAIQALGTRFIVNHHGEYQTKLTMLESKVKVSSEGNVSKNYGAKQSVSNTVIIKNSSPIISAGEQVKLNNTGLSDIINIDTAMQENRWQQHQLLVQNWSLPEVLTELNRFYNGYIHFDAASIQHIKVSAVLPLDKPEQALALINANFTDVIINHFTPWLTVVKPVIKDKR